MDYRDWGGKPGRCDICGEWKIPHYYIPVYCKTGDIVRVCKHGHFEGQAIHAFTNMPCEMTGDKSLDALIWFPEGYVPQLWDRFWNGRG